MGKRKKTKKLRKKSTRRNTKNQQQQINPAEDPNAVALNPLAIKADLIAEILDIQDYLENTIKYIEGLSDAVRALCKVTGLDDEQIKNIVNEEKLKKVKQIPENLQICVTMHKVTRPYPKEIFDA